MVIRVTRCRLMTCLFKGGLKGGEKWRKGTDGDVHGLIRKV